MLLDVRKVFNYFRNLQVVGDVTLQELSLKSAILLCFGWKANASHIFDKSERYSVCWGTSVYFSNHAKDQTK